MDYIIAVDGNLTSFVFYNEVLAQLHNYFTENNQSRILFDFSLVKMIDPLVLPNLLCTGFWISNHRGIPAKIFIPGSQTFASLRTFLDRTRFVELAQTYNLFEFDDSISGGLKETAFRTTLNRLELFQIAYQPMKERTAGGADFLPEIDVEQTKAKVWSQLKSSFVPFINEFLIKNADEYILAHKKGISSDLLSFCRELIENALLHGLSFCFLNMQYSPSFGKRIKISISDCGMGFKRSINADRSRSQQILALQQHLMEPCTEEEREHMEGQIKELLHRCYELKQEPARDDVERLANYPYLNTELEGIVYGLLSRRSKPYGLYNIHHKIIHSMGGTIRIHSNDTQLILSRRMWAPLEVSQTPESLLVQLANKQYAANVRTGLMFKGTHIEMEFMLNEQGESFA